MDWRAFRYCIFGGRYFRDPNELILLNAFAFSDFVVANNNTILDSSHSVPTPSVIVLIGFGVLGLFGIRQKLTIN